MSKGLAAFDRILIFILALVSILIGVFGVGVWANVDIATTLFEAGDEKKISASFDSPWYEVTLWAVAVLGILFGLWLIFANLRRRGFNQVEAKVAPGDGTVSLSLNRIASAIDASLSGFDHVKKVTHKVAMDRSRPTVTWTVTAEPEIDLPTLKKHLEQSEQDFREAIRDLDLSTVYKVHLSPVRS